MKPSAEIIQENDVVNGLLVTRLTAKFVICGEQRFSKVSLNKSGFEYKAKLSPNTEVDWTDKKAVIDYYNSFVAWNFYIAGGDKYETQLCEVKDNMVLYNGEYYLPAPQPNNGSWNAKSTKNIENGVYYINLYKRTNNWFGVKEERVKDINVFYVSSNIAKDENYIPSLSGELYIRPFDRHSGMQLNYSSSHRSGLSIDITLYDLFDFVSVQFYGNADKKQVAFFTQEFKNHFVDSFMEGESEVQKLKNEIREILSFSENKYHISDDESYGDYTLYNVQLRKEYTEQINKLVQDHIKKFKGVKYLKTLNEIKNEQ